MLPIEQRATLLVILSVLVLTVATYAVYRLNRNNVALIRFSLKRSEAMKAESKKNVQNLTKIAESTEEKVTDIQKKLDQ